MFGYSAAEAVGGDLHALVMPKSRASEAQKGIELFSATGSGPLIGKLREMDAVRKDGSTFPAEIGVAAMKVDDVWHAVGTVRDVSQRKENEAELVRYREYLEEVVVDRTEELNAANAELSNARDAAERANVAKSVFMANVSHEIRTPLNAIQGFADILRQQAEDPQSRGHLESILSGSRSLLDLFGNIMDLSRSESGELQLEAGPANIAQICGDVVSASGDDAEAKGLKVQVELEPRLPVSVELDGERLRQILGNLMDNAVKFTASGQVALHVEGEPSSSEPGRIDLSMDVCDTGKGIPDSEQEAIFEPFTQREGQSINEYGGTGLGLALTRRLVDAMDGTITVSSEEGVGSVFRVVIPAVPILDSTEIGDAPGLESPGAPEMGGPDPLQELDLAPQPETQVSELTAKLVSCEARWRALSATLTINEVEAFAHEMLALGQQCRYTPLEAWAERLLEQAGAFDMDGIARTLECFPRFHQHLSTVG
jgi:PAS domain S-box-containing protein